jgi:hypothetical protein
MQADDGRRRCRRVAKLGQRASVKHELTSQPDRAVGVWDLKSAEAKMHIIQSVGSLLWKSMGHCKTCTSKSFIASAATWFLSLFATGAAWPLTVALATALTVLWVTHLVIYAIKASAVVPKKGDAEILLGRRKILLFARALILAAAASAVPGNAFAMGSCGSCGSVVSPPHCWRANYDGTNRCSKCRSCGADCGNYVC